MSRYSRRTDPPVRPVERVELQEGHLVPRVLGVGLAIVIAAVAFGRVLTGIFTPQTGWQEIEAANPETGIAEQFVLQYNIGASGQAATAELKAVSAHYTEALDHAYRVLSDVQIEHYTNFYTLNHQPNEPVTVDPLLYQAVKLLEESGTRRQYFAPMDEQYFSLFSSTSDESAEKYDPEKSEDLAQFAAEIAAFARNPDAVSLELLPENQVVLHVSPEYSVYARENGVESFVNLGVLLNAFLCDAAADALVQQGYTNGFLTSFDGYARVFCTEEFGLPLVDVVDGKPARIGTARYTGPAVIVNLRSFPVQDKDQVNFYTYSDGTIRTPFIGTDGIQHTAASSLNTGTGEGSTAALAIRTVDAYSAETLNPQTLEGLSWITAQGGQIEYFGSLFQPAEENTKQEQ